ncbi:type 4a pilus biogenesis protein PilO [Marinospirillum alkaliphilum]|uniref:Type IV pilus assembly protein PilO n=1 Tax=Marinospirillum alkaliphilum DSM 21637 TaxID=1122209 RepID=A0A1K1W4U4_9GAMM|nr:type 4a pilus biogenesis protein PilO [Marinospirillum alkaliphilum]SFX32449.1 type IV pilus assembly protein PilO [Marinospirillum alkaliphilum DSM 21637]
MSKTKLQWPNGLKLNPELRRLIRHWFAGQWRAIKRLEKDDLDLTRSGQWPDSVKILSLLLLAGAVVYASHWLVLSKNGEELAQVRAEQDRLFEEYRTRSFQAANLAAYQQQMRIMEETFSGLLARLPVASEVPRLLDDIQLQAERQRLELQALTLRNAQPRDFYSELPFELEVRGDYHRIASFMAGIASLDRIITLHDFTLTPVNTGSQTLTLTLQARTYRYDQARATQTVSAANAGGRQ